MTTDGNLFPLMAPHRNPVFYLMVRLLIACALVGAAAAWTARLAHVVTLNQTWFYTGVAAISPAVLSALILWQMSGVVELSADGIALRSKAWKGFYRWGDVAGVDVATRESEGRLTHFLTNVTAVKTTPHVRVKLRRAPRTSLIASRDGTNVTVGVPRLLTRSLELYVSDPDGFVSAARHYLVA